MNRVRSAMTLIEIVIAIAIFMVVLGMAFQSLVATKRYETSAAAQDQVQYDIDAITRRISADLSGSGWYFYGVEDVNGNGILDPGEDINNNGHLDTVDYAVPGLDRTQRYYPFVTADTATARGTGFPARVALDAAHYGGSLSRLSPWTSALYPGWSLSSVATTATTIAQTATRSGLLVTTDLAREMAQPSSELIFLRVATGPWEEDPNDTDRTIPADMTFFPAYGRNAAGVISRPLGARAYDWRQPANWAALPHDAQNNELVLRPSAWVDDGHGGWVHRNSLLPVSNPQHGRPYGVEAWGAALDDGSSGPALRVQWETITADRMFFDPTTGSDDLQRPDDLREFMYAVVPSRSGFGRLVRAHKVVAAGTRKAGTEPGDWITDPSAARGFAIDLVLSDDVVRATWTTRRHDAAMAANQVRLRLVIARPAMQAVEGLRPVDWRTVDLVFSMRAKNEYQDQKDAEGLIDVSVPGNIPFVF